MTIKYRDTANLYRTAKPGRVFDIIIRTKGFELAEKLREAIVRKIGRVRKYEPKAFRARVHIEQNHLRAVPDRYRILVRYEIPGHDQIAEHRAHEPMAALDFVSEKIERRLQKRKTARLSSRSGRKARACRIAEFYRV